MNKTVRRPENEVHFFDNDINYMKGLDWYRSQMPKTRPENSEISIEKTPKYFHSRLVPERIHKMNPNIKLILVVRDPVVRLMSDYAQLLQYHNERNQSFGTFEDIMMLDDGSVNEQ